MQEKKIFFSYASPDFPIVDQVYKLFTKAGHSVFLDKYSLKPGHWRPQLDSAIRSRNVFVVFISKNLKDRFESRDGYAAYEYDLALQLSNNLAPSDFMIVPVRIDEGYRGDLSLQMYQQFDVFSDLEAEVGVLLEHIGEPSGRKTAVNEINAAVFRQDFLNAYAKIVSFEDAYGVSEKTTLNKSIFLYNMGRKQEAVRLAFELFTETRNIECSDAVVAMVTGLKDGEFAGKLLALPYFSEASALQSERTASSRKALLRCLAPSGQEFVRSPLVGTAFLTTDVSWGSTDPWGLHYSPARIHPDAVDTRAAGDVLVKGEPIVWLDSMASCWPLEVPFNCIVKEYLVKSGDHVDYDQPIAVVTKLKVPNSE